MSAAVECRILGAFLFHGECGNRSCTFLSVASSVSAGRFVCDAKGDIRISPDLPGEFLSDF